MDQEKALSHSHDCAECSDAARRSSYRLRLMLSHIQSIERERELQEESHRKAVAGLRKHIIDLEQTFSWRITAPLRLLRKFFRSR